MPVLAKAYLWFSGYTPTDEKRNFPEADLWDFTFRSSNRWINSSGFAELPSKSVEGWSLPHEPGDAAEPNCKALRIPKSGIGCVPRIQCVSECGLAVTQPLSRNPVDYVQAALSFTRDKHPLHNYLSC